MYSMARGLTVPLGERLGAAGASARRLAVLGAGLMALGCTGSVVGQNGGPGTKDPNEDPNVMGGSTAGKPGGSNNTGGAGGSGPMVVTPGAVRVGISSLRRLTAERHGQRRDGRDGHRERAHREQSRGHVLLTARTRRSD